MKKDNIRDYATEAFRFYAACGKLTSEQLKEKVRDEIYTESKKEFYRSGNGISADATAYAIQKAEDVIYEMGAEFHDIIAVEKTLLQLYRRQREAVEMVYFVDADKPLQKGDITDRVRKASLAIPADESSVYRWLAYARKLFAKERGLRVTEKEIQKIASSRP